ncbi:LppU/SCO3897 family protein [Cellulomonas sp. P5_C5]
MKFNPPPNWPTPPEGFAPEPGWTPDPSLPAPPPGWQLWVQDDVALPGETTEATRHYKQAMTSFLVGVGFFLAGAISTIVTANSASGIYWWGGMIVGGIALVRSFTEFRAARQDGAPSLSGVAKGLVAVGVVAVLGTGVGAASSFITSETTATGVGSCWTVGDDDTAMPVSCDSDHLYKVVSEVSSAEQCPDEMYLEADAENGVLCLQED